MSTEITVVEQPAQVVVGEGADRVTVDVTQPLTSVVEVSLGPSGPAGPIGPDGAAADSFEFTQSVASGNWIVNHNLGRKVSLTLYTVGGSEIEAEVLHTSINQCIAYFAFPIAGTARAS